MKDKYIEVVEDVRKEKSIWGIALGSPNPDSDHFIEMPNREKAFEVKNKIQKFYQINQFQTEQCFCYSFCDDKNILTDCTCGKCK